MKARIFIGSSSENKRIAEAIQSNLSKDYYPEIWFQSINGLTRSTLENLMDAINRFEFAIFVLSPDDITIIRKNEENTTRDNVIFEIGLFMGHLGRESVFFVKPNSIDMHLPTDLLGITYGVFEPEHPNLEASLAPFCNQVRTHIQERIFIDIPEDGDAGINILSPKIQTFKSFEYNSANQFEDTFGLYAKTNRTQKLTVKFTNDDKSEPAKNVWYYENCSYGWRISPYKTEQSFVLNPNDEGFAKISFMGQGSAMVEVFLNDEKKPFICKHIIWRS